MELSCNMSAFLPASQPASGLDYRIYFWFPVKPPLHTGRPQWGAHPEPPGPAITFMLKEAAKSCGNKKGNKKVEGEEGVWGQSEQNIEKAGGKEGG